MPDNRETVQVNQPNIINLPENNWPDPLVDPSNKLRVVVTNGQSGSQRNFDPVATSMQDQLSLPEGKSKVNTGNMNDQGGHGNKLQTSQQNANDHSTPESERSQ
jgi:hypothetical protein